MSTEDQSAVPSAVEEQIVYEWTLQNASQYIVPRVSNATLGLGILGASQHYYVGSGVFLGFYTFAFSAAIGSATFFTTTHILRNIRKKDDALNFAFSGALTGGLLFGLKNKRNGLMGALGGAVGGIVYKFGSEVVYDNFREMWIAQRRSIIESSTPKQISTRAMRIDPRGITEGSHIRYPEPEPFTPEKRK